MNVRNSESIVVQPSLGRKIVDGAIWNTFQLLAARGTALFVQLVLARILLPEHFGIVGMAAVFIDIIGAVGDLGLAAALIQFKKEKLTARHLDTAFWSSLGFNGLIFLFLVFVIGPFAAWFYNEPLLQVVLPVAGAENLLKSFGLIQRVMLTKELRFKPIGIIEATSSVLSGAIAIAAALAGVGAWSLIIKDLGFVGISLPLLWSAVKWRPRFRFSKLALKDTLGVGIYDALQSLFVFFTKNIDYLLVGKLLGAELLGIYTLAFILTDTFRQQIWAILSRVMFPVYAQVQEDIQKIRDYYLRIVKYNMIAVMPIMIIFISYAEAFLMNIVGEQWLLAKFPLQVMALSAIVMTMGGTTGSVLRGLGRFDLVFRLTAISAILVAIPAFAIGIYFFGINGAAVAVLIHQTTSRILFQYQMRKFISVREIDIYFAIRTPLIGTLAALPIIAATHLLFRSFDLLLLSISVFCSILVYCITIYLLNKTELIKIYQFLIKKRKLQIPA
jgi:O-antigen/teichoic acid export membrane protein